MPAAETAVMTATSASAAAAVAAGWPPGIVITTALLGGLISVWLDRRADITLTVKWLAGALVHALISASAGVALSALVLAVAPGYGWLAPLALAPQWTLAGVIAALIHRVAPLALAWASRTTGNTGGSNAS